MVSWDLNFFSLFFLQGVAVFSKFLVFNSLQDFVTFRHYCRWVLWFQSFVFSYVFVPLQGVALEVFLPRRLPRHGPHRGGQTGGVQELQEVWIHDQPHADLNNRHPVYKRFGKIGVQLHFLSYLKKKRIQYHTPVKKNGICSWYILFIHVLCIVLNFYSIWKKYKLMHIDNSELTLRKLLEQ